MQKKLIALAVAGLAAVPAIAADSSVTLYGLVDMGYSWRGDNYNSAKQSRSGFDSGQMKGTRLGVRGAEELSPGFNAIFTLEAGIAADTGNQNQGRPWGRQTFAGFDIQGAKLTMGHQYAPQFNMYAAYEPFGLGSVAEAWNIMSHVEGRVQNGIELNTRFYGDDSFGFAFDGMYSLGSPQGDGAPQPETGQNGEDTRFVSLFPKVKFGPATLMAGYTQWKTKGAEKNNNAVDVGLNLDFKVVQIFGAYARYNNGARGKDPIAVYNNSTGDFITDKVKFNRWFLGGKVPLGNFKLLASYAYSKDKNDLNMKAQQFGFGGTYSFSKRTDLYAVFSRIVTSDGINNPIGNYYWRPGVGDATNYTPSPNNNTGLDNGAAGTGAGYRSGLSLGMMHSF
ncbi:MAG: porin [Betaproteobacteria bacterium]|nr:porin [Betaproteobacteria bacterium]